ncbi:MAG: LysM peptidoglycan-binding domain-containing protein, partial [Bacteroidota bacterium]
YYQVKAGDDIYSIADKYKIRVDEIRAWNALVDVVAGDVIVVAKRELSVPQNATSSTNTNSTATNRGLPARTRGASTELDNRPSSIGTETYRNESTNIAQAQTQRIMRSDQNSLGTWMEKGKYLPYEGEKYQSNRFYALHKTLPVGSTFKVLIPGNVGFFEVRVVGRLDSKADAIAALSYDSIRLLQGAGYQPELTIYYE